MTPLVHKLGLSFCPISSGWLFCKGFSNQNKFKNVLIGWGLFWIQSLLSCPGLQTNRKKKSNFLPSKLQFCIFKRLYIHISSWSCNSFQVHWVSVAFSLSLKKNTSTWKGRQFWKCNDIHNILYIIYVVCTDLFWQHSCWGHTWFREWSGFSGSIVAKVPTCVC